jgi:hypothetical protein
MCIDPHKSLANRGLQVFAVFHLYPVLRIWFYEWTSFNLYTHLEHQWFLHQENHIWCGKTVMRPKPVLYLMD